MNGNMSSVETLLRGELSLNCKTTTSTSLHVEFSQKRNTVTSLHLEISPTDNTQTSTSPHVEISHLESNSTRQTNGTQERIPPQRNNVEPLQNCSSLKTEAKSCLTRDRTALK